MTRFDVNSYRDWELLKKLYWYGLYDTENMMIIKHFCYLLFFDSFRYILFRHRIRKHLVQEDNFIAEHRFFLQCIFSSNKKINACFNKIYELANYLQATG
jgi:hypothetical protein